MTNSELDTFCWFFSWKWLERRLLILAPITFWKITKGRKTKVKYDRTNLQRYYVGIKETIAKPRGLLSLFSKWWEFGPWFASIQSLLTQSRKWVRQRQNAVEPSYKDTNSQSAIDYSDLYACCCLFSLKCCERASGCENSKRDPALKGHFPSAFRCSLFSFHTACCNSEGTLHEGWKVFLKPDYPWLRYCLDELLQDSRFGIHAAIFFSTAGTSWSSGGLLAAATTDAEGACDWPAD